MDTFLSVCRTLNYTRSAAELSITQPAVSQHIAYLERAYQTRLLSYHGKKLSLTPAGELVRDAAAATAHDEIALRGALAALAGSPRRLHLGMTLTAGEYVLAAPVAKYLVEHADVQMRISSFDTARLLEQLHAGDLDCAFVEGFFDKSSYDWRVFSTERFAAVCAPHAPLAFADAPLHFEDLLDQHVLVRERGSGTRAVLEHALAARNLSVGSFARVTEVESINILKEFVAAGYGIAFLYEAAVGRELESGRLARIPLGGHPIEHDITFIRLKGSMFEGGFARLFDDLQAAQPGG